MALAAPVAARADLPILAIPWTRALPPRPGVPAPAHPAAPCSPAAPSCVDAVVSRMIRAWRPLDQACDHRAVFALTYLITTQGFRRYLSDVRGSQFFADEPWIIELDRTFADLYFSAVSRYRTGTAPPAWRIAFDAAGSGRTNGVQDLFLGMNAHIQRDLPVALAAAGLVDGRGVSHKGDHDRVNAILTAVLDPIEAELVRRYDPLFGTADVSPIPADEQAALEMLKAWREGAWRNAERLALARTRAARARVMAQIEAASQAWALLIQAPDFSWYRASRDAYCRRNDRNRPPGGTRNANSA